MGTVKFKFNEGDFVSIRIAPDMGNFMVVGLSRVNGGNKAIISNGESLYEKNEYELDLSVPRGTVKGLLGFQSSSSDSNK